MANKNYNKMSKPTNPKVERSVVVDQTSHETDPQVTAQVEAATTKKEESPKPKLGYVANCERLNVRAEPSRNSDVVGIINKGTQVELTEPRLVKGFYAVKAILSNGATLSGYCVKSYITVET